MASDLLYTLTLLTDFLCLGLSLWLAIYILARSRTNPLSFRAIVSLLALAFYFGNAFTEVINPSADTGRVRSIAVLIALVAAHDLTHYLLPSQLRRRLYWIARGFVLFAIVFIILHFYLPSAAECDPLYHCPVKISTPWVMLGMFQFLLFAAILYNLRQIRPIYYNPKKHAFYLALLLAASTVGYNFIGTVLNISVPRFVSNLLVLSALLFLAYSIARNQTSINRRTTIYDLPVTLLTIVCIVIVYLLIAWEIKLSPQGLLFITILAIFTHSAYDFVRESLDRLFHNQERLRRRQFRIIGQKDAQELSLHRYLRRGLAILCHNLQASSGFIALKQSDRFEVVASLHSLSVGTQFPPQEVQLEELARPAKLFADKISWLAPVTASGEQLAVVGIGARVNNTDYEQEELDWLEDVSDEIAKTLSSNLALKINAKQESGDYQSEDSINESRVIENGELLSTLAIKLDPEFVKHVEEGLRNMNDYSRLGDSPLVDLLGVKGDDHIERGRCVQQRLIQILEKLRPGEVPPREPLPHEWYSYTILHEAYVKENPAREIMAKLYISEGTYYRTRRKALRGVARVMLETQAAG